MRIFGTSQRGCVLERRFPGRACGGIVKTNDVSFGSSPALNLTQASVRFQYEPAGEEQRSHTLSRRAKLGISCRVQVPVGRRCSNVSL